MDDNISGFFNPVEGYGNPDLATFTQIPTSEDGRCDLYRGERAGRFRVYKCLKPRYRGSLLHEGILRKEFEQGYSLRHINICEIYSYMEVDGLGNCIEMEWIDGVTLDEYLRRGRPDERTFQKIASQICDALDYMHRRGVIHRDIKLSNIMVSHNGCTVKLIDFGFSDDPSSSIFKAPAGSFKWVAPEVLSGTAADARSDIYSLGAVLREMTFRHRACIAKCTAADPAKRYGSAEEVKAALNRQTPIWPILLIAALAVALIVITALLVGKRHSTVENPPAPAVADTIYVLPANASVEDRPDTNPAQRPSDASKKKQSSEPKQDKSIDEIFEQASDLFEENL